MTLLIETRELAVAAADSIVQPTSIRVRAGVPFTILGETGSGKTLLAQAIAGTLPDGLVARGEILIAGRPVQDLAVHERRALWGREIAILPQEPWLALDPTARSIDQVAEVYEVVRRRPADGARDDAVEAMRSLRLEGAGRKLPSELSGGMAQRVALAASRAGGARIMLADEPTKGLDAALRDGAIDLLREAMGSEGGLLTITHDISVPRRLGGEVAIMLAGRIIEQGPVEDVLQRPRHDYTRRLVAADPANWIRRIVPERFGDPVIEARGLAKFRGGRLLFSGLSLTIARGEIVGVVGPSGSGKSSLGDLVLGLIRPDAGSVRRDPRIAPLRFQKLYQDPPAAFAPQLTIRRALADLVARHRLDATRISDLMRRLRLSDGLLDRPPGAISGGELQRFALLRVLLLKPAFLFADEPTSRLDLITQQEMIELIVESAREEGCAVLLVSHDRDLIDKTADRVLALEGSWMDRDAVA
ncbi:peptide/nickel transport system ATP-binding protein [Tepidamorphus gemmatus]|uniref:Peptide/nickel transport system ATP-binding protein n=1 Tax=Tepidamorphus gemmatus TaxID=747076 RepID=A0A4R3M2S2_9HYPH|nr:ATP-binding cassette domain-containing protein [Tepidamorphus gemmatus]TCT06519.1 peptide/nickel transport system ATP-binding protein [Tepidamorphus gemmatus]